MGGSSLTGAKIVALITGSDTWVPAELVWGSYPHYGARTGSAISPVAHAGLAAGSLTEFVVRSVLREMVDAMTFSWTGRGGMSAFSGVLASLIRQRE